MTDEEAQPRVRVALINDVELVVAGLAAMLAPFRDLHVVAAATTTDLAEPVDVALFDTYGRAPLPWSTIGTLEREPNVRHVALFTFSFQDHLVRRALDAGVEGYLWKGLPAGELADALRRVGRGEEVVSTPGNPDPDPGYRWPYQDLGITARESEVLALLVQGMTNRTIAHALYIGEQTVKSHVRRIYAKLGVHSRAEATARALTSWAYPHSGR